MIGVLQTSHQPSRKDINTRQKTTGPYALPVSAAVCCKIMEHVIASQIMSHGEKKNILYPLQHGFRRGRSCETQLIEFIDDLSKNL